MDIATLLKVVRSSNDISTNKIPNKSADWGMDETNGLPYSGEAVQEFIKATFEKKAGMFYYDATNNRYLVFADSSTRDEYLEDPQKVELILGTFDAPFNYSAEINLTTPTYVAVLNGSVGNYIDFTFDTKNKQGQSVGEDVLCTFTFIRNSVKKVVNQKYRYGTAVHFNIDDYLESGTNTITVGIVGQNTLAATTIGITYQVIDLKITDTFDIAQVYNLVETPQSSIAIPYTISGSGIKTMEWYLDGEQLEFIKNEDEVVEVTSSRTKYISIEGLSQGRHSIQFRAYTIINEEKFYSETLYRDFMVYKIEDLKEIIAIAITLPIGQDIITENEVVLKGITQYVPYTLRFATFNPSATNSNVQILLDDSVVANFVSVNGEENTYSIVSTTSGSKTLKIRTDSSEYVIPIEINESDTSLIEIVEGLQLDLQAIGKSNNSLDKDVWEYGKYTTTFKGFSWNKISGWVDNRLLISNGASIEVNIAPLSTDATASGKTMEFEFATTNVSDDNAVICDLRNSNGTGLLITASEVTLQSAGGTKVTTKYKSEENIRISLVINKKANTANKLLAFIYINGVISGAVNFASTDNFTSSTSLKIASTSSADVKLKQLRFYDAALTSDQLLNNYILYRDTAEELVSLYDRNNIYAEDGYSFSTDILSGQLPIMIVTGDIPTLENTTDKNLEIVVDVEYINLQDPSRSFKVENGIMRPQGTSSMSYPKKNYRLYTQRRDNTILYDADGKMVADKLYSFKQGAQPVNCWCMKADYAESSGTHNTGIARLWNEVMTNARIDGEYVCRTQAQKSAQENNYPYDVRTTVDGFPILMFYRLTVEDDLIFIGKYNFNNDKSTESVFGFEGIPGFDNTHMQCWEVLNNGHHLALFQDVDNFDSEWTEAFEARYPDVGEDADITDLKAFATWLVSTKDNPEKFKTEKSEHLDLWKIAAYYIYFMRFGAVDQTVKNAMFTSEDGQHFYYINYDNDTINGVRNDGLLIYPPTIDRQSLDETFSTTVYAYAGHDSTLWNNLEADEEFMQMVSDIDNALYTAGLSYANVVAMFDDKQSDIWCERVYNQDAQYKYIGPYTDSGINNLYMLQGKRQSHRRWWLSRRFNYLDAKFASGEYRSNTFEIKMAGAPIGIDFSITSGYNMYYGYGVNNIPIETLIPLNVGESHTFTTKQVLNIGDPLRIYSAVNLQEIDVHNFIEYLSTVNMDKVYNQILGTKLKKLILGVDVSSDTRRNSSLTEISGLRSAQKLEYLDISGFQSISYLDLTPFQYFTTLKAKQSGLTSVDFAEGALLQLAELPETLQALVMNSLTITPENLKIENTWASLRYLEVRNCDNFKTNFAYFQDWYRSKSVSNKEATLIVEGIEWTNVTCSQLVELGQLKVDGGTLVLKGKIRLTEITQEYVNIIISIFGPNCFNPTNDLYITAPDAIFIAGPTEIYEGDSAQYSAAIFSEYIGSSSFSIVSGSGATIDSKLGKLTTTEIGVERQITVRVTHTPTQGIPTTKDLSVLLKKRIYPTLEINGTDVINSKSTRFDLSFTPQDYNGNFTVRWELTGEAVSENILRISSQADTYCVIEMTEFPSGERTATLTVIMTKGYGEEISVSKELIAREEFVIMTSESNPEVMAICYNQGWSASPESMTNLEAREVSNIDTVFRSSNIKSFKEFAYFTKITNIRDYAFYECEHLTDITIPDSVTSLGIYCFSGCTGLAEINFTDNIKSIGTSCFSGCTRLTEINIPDSVTSLGDACFRGCINLKRIIISSNKNYSVLDETFLIQNNDNSLIAFAPYNKASVIIPDRVTRIGVACFGELINLQSVVISDSVTSLGSSAFEGCTGLTDINIPDSVISLEDKCFRGCTGLTEINIPDSVTSINNECFYGCTNLREVNIPDSVTSLGISAFGYCKNLIEINITNGVTNINNKCFSGCTLLKKMTINRREAPTLAMYGNPFGSSSNSYTGVLTASLGINKLIVPENATGYDTGQWLDPLCNPSKCGFTLEKSLPAVETIDTLSAKNKALTEQNNILMAFASMYINTMSLSVDDSLDYKSIYPKWEDKIGTTVKPPFKFRYGEEPNDKLYEVIKEHTLSKEWIPGNGTNSLYKVISKDPEAGTIENPIEWSKGMQLYNGKYYTDAGVLYECIRDSGIPLEYSLAELVPGGYVKPVEK